MMPRRVSFKRPVVPTVNIDQFEVDLWDTSMSAATEFKTYHFECRLMRVKKQRNSKQYLILIKIFLIKYTLI